MGMDITGYRELSGEDRKLIVEGKMLGKQLGEFIERLRSMPGIDHRWLNIAQTDIQTGLMALTRSIARPDSF